VIIWTVKDLSIYDQARLRKTAQAVVMKGSDGAAGLVRELDAFFLPRPAGIAVRREESVAGECILIVDDNEMNVKLLALAAGKAWIHRAHRLRRADRENGRSGGSIPSWC